MLVGIMIGGIMLVFIMPGVIRISVIWLDVVVPTGLAFKKKIKIIEKEKKNIRSFGLFWVLLLSVGI